jgi:acyl-CoA synthetase (AMP-forming)/AMP-acid ligase II
MINAPSGPLALSHWQPDQLTPAHGGSIGDVLRAAVSRAPERAALISGDRWWTYRDLLTQATDGAHALLASFVPGDVVAVWADNGPQWVVLEFAAGLAGLILVPVHPSAGAEEVAYALAHSGARGIFIGTDPAGSSRAGVLRSVAGRLPSLRFVISLGEWDALCAVGSVDAPSTLPEVDPASLAQVLYTAGTTGRPKAALLTHRSLTGNAGIAARTLGGRDGDTVVNSLPLSHVTGCGLMALGIAQLAGTHVLPPGPAGGTSAASLLALAGRHRGELLCVDPPTLGSLLADSSPRTRGLGPRGFRSLRAIISGGAPLPPDLAHEAETAFGVPVVTGLFQTESGCVVTATSPEDPPASRLGSAGRPLPGTEMKITSLRTGDVLPCGEIGEIRVRGGQVMNGYLNDPGLTAQVLDGAGWLRTGDLGSMDSRGYCRVAGRVRELIVRGGQAVYPREVEVVLSGHPAVAEVAVVGVPDRYWGETVAAIVRLGDSLEEPALALTEYCGTRLASHLIPVRWLFADRLPRTAHGEIRKIALSTRFTDAAGPGRPPEPEAAPLQIPRQEPRSRTLEDIDF